jgi:bifunctional ADP-heptose synthase (sugar kinase/adenylyltransferase)
LIVAIDSDERVRQLKGPTRPRNSQWDRAFILAALRAVDEVHVFNSSEELEKLTQTLQPDIMVVGSDYRHKPVIGSQHTKELVFFDRIPHLSTTAILENSPGGRKLL